MNNILASINSHIKSFGPIVTLMIATGGVFWTAHEFYSRVTDLEEEVKKLNAQSLAKNVAEATVGGEQVQSPMALACAGLIDKAGASAAAGKTYERLTLERQINDLRCQEILK